MELIKVNTFINEVHKGKEYNKKMKIIQKNMYLLINRLTDLLYLWVAKTKKQKLFNFCFNCSNL